jgi:hypothetical protein
MYNPLNIFFSLKYLEDIISEVTTYGVKIKFNIIYKIT